MIIGIDGNEANIKNRVGIGQYAYNILVHFNKLNRTDAKFIIYLKDKPSSDLPSESELWKYKVFGPKKLWTQIALPFKLFTARKKPDIFFTPSHYAPRFSPVPTAVSVMDMSFVRYPELFTRTDILQLQSWTAYSVKNSLRVFTISQFSKQEIASYYKIPPDKITVTYPGYDKEKFRIQNPCPFGRRAKSKIRGKNVIRKYNIAGEYILFVGTFQPRKNILRLIEAFEKVVNKRKNLSLVLAGKKGWMYDEIINKTKTSDAGGNIIVVNFVAEDELVYLYQNAQCLILPSLYEGFGLPVVEAFACGCPVIVSNVSSLPEIVGDAGLYINPRNVAEMAQEIEKLLSDGSLRIRLIKKGLQRANDFSWESCASQTLKILMS